MDIQILDIGSHRDRVRTGNQTMKLQIDIGCVARIDGDGLRCRLKVCGFGTQRVASWDQAVEAERAVGIRIYLRHFIAVQQQVNCSGRQRLPLRIEDVAAHSKSLRLQGGG